MGRRKKMTEAELESTQTALTIEDANQSESEEAELLSEVEPPSDVSTEKTHEAAVEETKAETPKKPRKPRATKSKPSVVEIEEAPTELDAKNQDPWAAIKNLSDSVQKLVELNQHNQKSQTVPLPAPELDFDTHEILRSQSQTQANSSQFITKFAIAASVVAVLISLVSLALSQSARQAAVGASQIAQQTPPSVSITRGARKR